MRFMIIVKATRDSEAGVMPPESLLAEMGGYHEELAKAGMLLDGSGLQPTAKGWRIRYSGGKRTFTDGPFAETRELVAGYTMIQAKSKEEAVEWTKRFPNPSIDGKDGEIEVRQLFELEDFGPSEAIDRMREMDSALATGRTGHSPEEAEMRGVIARQTEAIRSKNVDRIMEAYANDAVLFDVKPPYQVQGNEAIRRVWQESLPCFPDDFDMDQRDITVYASGDTALCHWIFRFTGKDKSHPMMQSFMRISAGCRRTAGKWEIVHEHLSVPFDPESGKAAFTLNP